MTNDPKQPSPAGRGPQRDPESLLGAVLAAAARGRAELEALGTVRPEAAERAERALMVAMRRRERASFGHARRWRRHLAGLGAFLLALMVGVILYALEDHPQVLERSGYLLAAESRSGALLVRPPASDTWLGMQGTMHLAVGSVLVAPLGDPTLIALPEHGLELLLAPSARLVVRRGNDPVELLHGAMTVRYRWQPGADRRAVAHRSFGLALASSSGRTWEVRVRLETIGTALDVAVSPDPEPAALRLHLVAGAASLALGKHVAGRILALPLGSTYVLAAHETKLIELDVPTESWTRGALDATLVPSPGPAASARVAAVAVATSDPIAALVDLARDAAAPDEERRLAVLDLGLIDTHEAIAALIELWAREPALRPACHQAFARFRDPQTRVFLGRALEADTGLSPAERARVALVLAIARHGLRPDAAAARTLADLELDPTARLWLVTALALAAADAGRPEPEFVAELERATSDPPLMRAAIAALEMVAEREAPDATGAEQPARAALANVAAKGTARARSAAHLAHALQAAR